MKYSLSVIAAAVVSIVAAVWLWIAMYRAPSPWHAIAVALALVAAAMLTVLALTAIIAAVWHEVGCRVNARHAQRVPIRAAVRRSSSTSAWRARPRAWQPATPDMDADAQAWIEHRAAESPTRTDPPTLWDIPVAPVAPERTYAAAEMRHARHAAEQAAAVSGP